MPDISKLPELAELFGVTVDELLRRSALLVEHAAGLLEKYASETPVTVEKISEAAPLLLPFNYRLIDKSVPLCYHQGTPVIKRKGAKP